MKRQSTILLHILWICFTIGILGCGEEPPPVRAPKPVSKKITVQPTKQSTASTAPTETKKEAATTVQSNEGSAKSATAAASTDAKSSPLVGADAKPSPLVGADAKPSPLVEESMKLVSAYDPTGRFDPFEPLFKEESQAPAVSEKKVRRVREHERTPLEKVALSQLKLTAIIRAPSGNRALVEDATGKGYVVAKGTFIGLNSGQVTEIDNDRIVIQEEIENVVGDIEIQNEELKLQKPAGEL